MSLRLLVSDIRRGLGLFEGAAKKRPELAPEVQAVVDQLVRVVDSDEIDVAARSGNAKKLLSLSKKYSDSTLGKDALRVYIAQALAALFSEDPDLAGFRLRTFIRQFPDDQDVDTLTTVARQLQRIAFDKKRAAGQVWISGPSGWTLGSNKTEALRALRWLAEGQGDTSDLGDSLEKLAKFNGGLWKSVAQARFLQSAIGNPENKDRAAEAWAHKNGFEGIPFVSTKMLDYGKRDITRVRYVAKVFVTDTGGVVAIGKVKVNHPTKENPNMSLDWSDVKTEFVREVKPAVTVDVDAERAAAAAENKPDMDLIKTIPGWETKDILVSFLRQLENGRKLSAAQMGVVTKMLPDPAAVLGGPEQWEGIMSQFALLMVRMTQARKKGAVAAYAAAYEKDPQGNYGTAKIPPAEYEKEYDTAITAFMTLKFPESVEWITDEMMHKAVYWGRTNLPGYVGIGAAQAQEIFTMAAEAIKARKPSKKNIAAVQWMASVVQRMGNPSLSALEAMFAKIDATK